MSPALQAHTPTFPSPACCVGTHSGLPGPDEDINTVTSNFCQTAQLSSPTGEPTGS